MGKVEHQQKQLNNNVFYWFSVATKKVSLSCGNQDGFFANIFTAPPRQYII